MPPTDKLNILFLAANPVDTEPLRLDEELRAIDRELRKTAYRDRFDLHSASAVRYGGRSKQSARTDGSWTPRRERRIGPRKAPVAEARKLGQVREEGRFLRLLAGVQAVNQQSKLAEKTLLQSLALLAEHDPYEAACTKLV